MESNQPQCPRRPEDGIRYIDVDNKTTSLSDIRTPAEEDLYDHNILE